MTVPDAILTTKRHLHFMGIGGVGMSGLARLCHSEGHKVSGCDLDGGEALEALRQAGIPVCLGHHPEHLEGLGSADVLVISMAVPEGHPEVLAARAKGLRVVRRIELLAEIMAKPRSIGITGTHGKSTTTGMIASIMLAAGEDAAILIGGNLPAIGSNVRCGLGRLVAEVDESDPGFQEVRCELAVITNLEDDHIAGGYQERRNYHESLDELCGATRRFAEGAKRVLYCRDWPLLHDLLDDLPWARSYGLSDQADYRVGEIALEGTASRFLFRANGKAHKVRLAVPGHFNVQNAAAALAAAHLMGIDLAVAKDALAHYRSVGRRWQRWGSIGGALVIDDYAHHPTEVGATLEAARATGRRVRAVLQPHRFVRTARLWPALADAAGLADEIVVLDIYAAGEEAIEGISSQLIVERLVAGGKRASHLDMAAARDYLSGSLQAGDLVITLGAGDVWKVARDIVEAQGGDDGSA
jgi:UDP-N-acetylmuramate--alanine ligase